MSDQQIYRKWRQSSPEYNKKESWPASLFPDADYHYFKECGCLVNSLAIMLRHYQIEKETDPSLFNPWILNQRLIDCGAFNSYANLDLRYIDRLYPISYAGIYPFTEDAMTRFCHQGDPFLITVPGIRAKRHFIVPDRLTEDGMTVIDCAWGKTHLTEFDKILELRLFHQTEPV